MANPLFGVLGNNNPLAMLSQLKSNPLAVLRQAGYNVPTDISSPQAIVQHLVSSGQVSQDQINRAQMMAQNFKM